MTVEIYVMYRSEGKYPHYATYRFTDLEKARAFEYKTKYKKNVVRLQRVIKA